MPWKSDQQRKWGNSPAGIKAMGQAKVDEFNQASKGMSLPDKLKHALKNRGKKKSDRLGKIARAYYMKGK